MPAAAAWAFLVVWAACHLLYPFWFPLSGSFPAACLVFSLLCALAVASLRLLRASLEGAPAGDAAIGPLSLPKDPFLWVLLALAAAMRLYPMTLPVHLWAGGDEAAHMGLPALPFKVWARQIGFPFLPVFWIAGALAVCSRRLWLRAVERAVLALAELRLPAMGAAGLAAALYFGAAFETIRRLAASGHPSLPSDLLRSPPLGHWIHGLFYAAFGVSDLAGRLPEFFFACLGAVLIYRLALELGSRASARIAALLYLFLPPLAYYSMRGSQTHGELFFHLLTAHAFGLWLKEGRPARLYGAVLAASVGCLYRYTTLPLVPFLAAAALAFHRREPERLPLDRSLMLGCSGLALGLTVPWAVSYLCYGLRPYGGAAGRGFWRALLEPALSLPSGVSWPAAVFLGLGFIAAAAKPKSRLQWYLMGWFAAYYLFIAADLGSDVRLTLPLYPPLILWGADLAATAGEGALGLCALGAMGAYLLAAGVWLLVPPMEPRYNLRRSLETEYVPLKDAARALERLPEGTGVLTVDCSRGCFGFYLARPDRLRWATADSQAIRSVGELAALCRREGAGTVLYAAGAPEAFGSEKNPELFSAFAEDRSHFVWRADFRLGKNRIAIKDCF